MLPTIDPERRQRQIELSNLIAENLFTWHREGDWWVNEEGECRYAVAGSNTPEGEWFIPARRLGQADSVLVLMSLFCHPLRTTWMATKDEFSVEDASHSMAICRLAEMLINRERVPLSGQIDTQKDPIDVVAKMYPKVVVMGGMVDAGDGD